MSEATIFKCHPSFFTRICNITLSEICLYWTQKHLTKGTRKDIVKKLLHANVLSTRHNYYEPKHM